MATLSKYLLVKRKESDFTTVYPFLIEKDVTAWAESAVKDTTKAANGLLAKTLNGQQGSKLLKLRKIGEIDVRYVIPHTILNTTKEVIVCKNFLNCREEETSFLNLSQYSDFSACVLGTLRRVVAGSKHAAVGNRFIVKAPELSP